MTDATLTANTALPGALDPDQSPERSFRYGPGFRTNDFFRVTSLDAKLFAWHRVKMQYEEARARLKAAMGAFASDDLLGTLDAEVDRLRDEMNALLGEIDAARRERTRGAAAAE